MSSGSSSAHIPKPSQAMRSTTSSVRRVPVEAGSPARASRRGRKGAAISRHLGAAGPGREGGDAGAERAAGRPQRDRVERHVPAPLGREPAAEIAAEQDGLSIVRRGPRTGLAGQLADRRPDLDLADAVATGAADRDERAARSRVTTELPEPAVPEPPDQGRGGEALDVLD